MGWEIELPGRDAETFESKAAAERWLERYYRTLPFYERRRIAGYVTLGYKPTQTYEDEANAWSKIIEGYEGDPQTAYMNYLKAKAEDEGFDITFDMGDPTEGGAVIPGMDPRTARSASLTYKLTPKDAGSAVVSSLSAMDTSGTGAGAIGAMLYPDSDAFTHMSTETNRVTLYWDANQIGDQESYMDQIAKTDGGPLGDDEGYEGNDAGSGLDEIDRDLDLAKMEYQKWEYERELWTKSDIMAGMNKPNAQTAQKVWDKSRKYVDSTQANDYLGGPGQLGSAVANLYDQGRDRLADALLESELQTIKPESGWTFKATGTNTAGPDDFNTDFGDSGYWYGGGGGGGGYSVPEPVYRPPDRREVEDEVRAILTGMVGIAENSRLQRLTDKYMSAHKRAWDNEDLGLNPKYDVIEDIRKAADYKFIHKLRPDTVDEMDWIAERTYMAQRAGMSDMMAQGFSIDQATVGAAVGDIADAASINRFAHTGLSEGTLFDRIGANARNMLGGLR